MLSPDFDNEFLRRLVKVPVDETISPDLLQSALSGPPFITLPGSLNVRDIGSFASDYVKKRTVFRSGTLDFIASADRHLLRSQLGLTKIYDFRRPDEIKQPIRDVDGIEILFCPYKDGTEMPEPIATADFAPMDGADVGNGYRRMYDGILQGYTTGFRKVFEGLHDANESSAFLFHCTVGKDRTGVMTALILELMGAPVQLIAEEYALTRIGVEPFREKLWPAVIESYGGPVASDQQLNHAAPVQRSLNIKSPGLRDMLGIASEVMVGFIEQLRNKYGGAKGYLTECLGFTNDQIRQIQDNLRPGP
ncbi:unnamed protein product [Fusarium langsethiae]|nr:unnamed protein product [Fusarium langsethiae]GKU22962.1 unnamed protein product [Fusarium langsethiae]